MKKYLLSGVLAVLCICVSAQNKLDAVYVTDSLCNRNVEIQNYLRKLPKDICIPFGYHISFIRSETDINNDGLLDFIFEWNSPELKDGDTIFISCYLQNPDLSYSHLKSFKHLYPVYFKDYSASYVPIDSTLKELKNRMVMGYALKSLKFEGMFIKIEFKADAASDFCLEYKFDVEKENWFLIKSELTNFEEDHRDWSKVFGPSIDDFTYFYWEK